MTLAKKTPRGKDDLLRVADVADMLHVSSGWVRRSTIPVVVLGRARRYRLEDVQRHVEASIARRKTREEL